MMFHRGKSFLKKVQQPKIEPKSISNRQEKHIAFNTHLLLMIFFLFCSLSISISCFSESSYSLAIGFLCLCLLPLSAFLISPMYVVFTTQGVTIIYLWGIKEYMEWHCIRDITEYGSWFCKYSTFPGYHIAYPQKEKFPFFVDSNIPKTRKTKKLIKMFYNHEINKTL